MTADRELLLDALEDAAAYREDRTGGYCRDCVLAADGACPDHVGDLDKAGAYRALADVLEAAQ